MLMFYLQLIETEEDQRLFVQLYEDHRKQMLWVANQILHSTFLAEDAVHIAFVGVAKKIQILHNLRFEDRKNYLLKAAKNAAITISRKEKQQQELLPETNEEMLDDDVLESCCIKENSAAAVDAISQLKEPYSTVLYYYFVMEMEPREIAEVLQRKSDAVRQQISRGKKLLYSSLKEASVHHV